MRAYLHHRDEVAGGQGASAAAEMSALFERNVERLDAEIERMPVRRSYLRLKADIWAARRDGDEEAESRAVETVVDTAESLLDLDGPPA